MPNNRTQISVRQRQSSHAMEQDKVLSTNKAKKGECRQFISDCVKVQGIAEYADQIHECYAMMTVSAMRWRGKEKSYENYTSLPPKVLQGRKHL